MRLRLAPLSALLLAACATTLPRGPVLERTATAPVVDFLLTSAATDFHAHRPPDPIRFRQVRVAHRTEGSGPSQDLLCGEFLPAGEGAQWTPFATIKTSGYEQWVGGQASAFCQGPSVTFDPGVDLSGALLERLNSVR